MPQKRLHPSRPAPARPSQPVQDMTTANEQAGQFPGVGMTLNSYKYDSRDHYGRAGQSVIKKGRWARLKEATTLKRAAVTLSVVVLLLGGWLGGKFLYNAHKLFGGNILGFLNPTRLRGEDQGRVNILLAGNSADDVGHSGGQLTDSIMLVSIDTKNKKAFMLSIPRDLWVQVPGDGHEKINAVYVRGQESRFQSSGYPSGGMGMLEKIVSDNFGLPVHYYALVNYTALRQAVNAVGGIDVKVKSEDSRGLYDPNIDYSTGGPLVKLSNGWHHLNGQQALNLARARGDSYNSYGYAGSDFTRTEHQRKILIALKNEVSSTSTLTNPAKLGSLSDAIGNNIKTDFKTNEVRRLYDILKTIDSRNIKSLGLDKDGDKSLLASYATPRGDSALIPAAGVDDFSVIKIFMRKQTSSSKVVQEGASVVVLNATDTTGLASRISNKVDSNNLTVVGIGDARTNQAKTTIIDNSDGKKPASRQALSKLFGNQFSSSNPYRNMYDADFIILVGSDQAS